MMTAVDDNWVSLKLLCDMVEVQAARGRLEHGPQVDDNPRTSWVAGASKARALRETT